MRQRLVHLLVLGCAVQLWSAAPVAAQTASPRFDLQVARMASQQGDQGGHAYQITSSGTVAATPAAVWRILTDYEHLADYLPNLHSARVLARSGDSVIVEQRGAARFLFFSQPIHLVVQVRERAPDRIDISLIEGDMKVYRTTWELTPVAGAAGTRVSYSATIEPKFDVPGVVGTTVIKNNIAQMMAAVLARLDRPQ